MEDDKALRLAKAVQQLKKQVSELSSKTETIIKLQGPKGDKGDTGKQGLPGIQGARGRDGVDGKDGRDGVDGVGIASVEVTFDNSLLVRLTDGTELDAGEIQVQPTANGQTVVIQSSSTPTGWKDLLAPLSGSGVPPSSAPTLESFTVGTITRREYAFKVGDYLYVQPFHINHDAKPNGKAYLHVHWTTHGTQTGVVKWRFDILRALGHDQEAFKQITSIEVEQEASGTPYKHMVTEASDAQAFTMVEPDELILVTITRITNGGTNVTDRVFGLMVDIHYESDRGTTPQKAPNFFIE